MRKLSSILITIALATSCSALNPAAPSKTATIVSFTSDASIITINSTTILRWDAQGSNGLVCRIDPLIGNVSSVGYLQIQPFTTTTYSLTCTIDGLNPVIRLLTITVR